MVLVSESRRSLLCRLWRRVPGEMEEEGAGAPVRKLRPPAVGQHGTDPAAGLEIGGIT